MMLKTTRADIENLLAGHDTSAQDYGTTLITNIAFRSLCHDAGRAGELDKELEGMQLAYLRQSDLNNRDRDKVEFLEREIADLHAKLDRYTRIAESGKSYGDDLDNIERIGELELEATQDALDIERALSGQRLLYNRPLAIRVADLRAKLEAIKNLVCGEAQPNWENTPATTNSRGWIADVCDSAPKG